MDLELTCLLEFIIIQSGRINKKKDLEKQQVRLHSVIITNGAFAIGRSLADMQLDVFDVEPLPADDPIRTLPNTLLTPHLGFVTEPVFARFAQGVVEGLLAWLRAEKPPRMLS